MFIPYEQRAEFCTNAAAKRLCQLMARKQTNLAIAADVTTAAELITLAEAVGPHICLLKTHIDVLDDFSQALLTALHAIAQKHHFLIFEDRKFADIGHTTQLQYTKGVYHIATWSDMITAHSVPGPGILEGLKAPVLAHGSGVLLLAQMSSSGALATGTYTDATVAMALHYPDVVAGFIAQHRVTEDPRFLHLTPGISFEQSGDALGQQYNTPETAIARGSDVLIVGRGITKAKDPADAAARYQAAGWKVVMRS